MSTKPLQSAALRSRVTALMAATIVCAALAIARTPPASAAPEQTPTPAPAVVPDPSIAAISPDLALVAVDSPQYRAAKASFEATAKDLAGHLQDSLRIGAEAQIAQLTAQDRDLTQQLARDTAARKQAASQLTTVRSAIKAIAVTSYVDGPPQAQLIVDLDKANEAAARAVMFSAVTNREQANEVTATALLTSADQALNNDLNQRTQAACSWLPCRPRTTKAAAARGPSSPASSRSSRSTSRRPGPTPTCSSPTA